MMQELIASGLYLKVPILFFFSMVVIFVFSIFLAGLGGDIDTTGSMDVDTNVGYFGRMKHLFTSFGLLISSGVGAFISIIIFFNVSYFRVNYLYENILIGDIFLTILIFVASLFISNNLIKNIFNRIKESQSSSISDNKIVGSSAKINRLYDYKHKDVDYVIGRATTDPTAINGNLRETITFIIPASNSKSLVDCSFVILTGEFDDCSEVMEGWYKERGIIEENINDLIYSVKTFD